MDEILTQRRIRSSAILATFCLLQAHPLRRNMSAIRTASRRVCLAPSAFRQAPRASFAVAPRVVVQHTRGPTSGATASLGLSCLLLALPAAAALSAPAESVEPATKIAFSTSLDNLPLLGTGCRYKWGMVKVYAVGLYAQGAAECAKGASGLMQGLVDSTQKKAVVIKMARGLDSQKLVDALDEAFKPRLALPGRSATNMALFMKVVQEAAGGQCDAGDEFTFSITGGNTMTITAMKAKQGGVLVQGTQAVVDADICFALVDTYLGGTLAEVAPTLTADIKNGLKA